MMAASVEAASTAVWGCRLSQRAHRGRGHCSSGRFDDGRERGGGFDGGVAVSPQPARTSRTKALPPGPKRPPRPPGDSGALDDPQVERRLIERIRASGAAEDDVLETHTPATLDVDAGLNAERHAGAERLRVARDQVGLLMHLEPDAMARSMDEIGPITG